jgi:hypothetical protein
VELERDQLRAERDRFRNILSAAQRYPFQSPQYQFATLGVASPPAGQAASSWPAAAAAAAAASSAKSVGEQSPLS